MANKEKGSLLFRITRGRLGKAPEPKVQSITLQPVTREEGVALQRRHGMNPVYEFHPPVAQPHSIARRETAPTSLRSAGDVAMYMAGSSSRAEWDKRADAVKAANGGNYPSSWYQAVVLSGLANETSKRWQE